MAQVEGLGLDMVYDRQYLVGSTLRWLTRMPKLYHEGMGSTEIRLLADAPNYAAVICYKYHRI